MKEMTNKTDYEPGQQVVIKIRPGVWIEGRFVSEGAGVFKVEITSKHNLSLVQSAAYVVGEIRGFNPSYIESADDFFNKRSK